VAPLLPAPARLIWRLSVPPAAGAQVVQEISKNISTLPMGGRGRGNDALAPDHYYDWSGGLIWLALPPADDARATAVRTAVARSGGHATLMRAPAATRLAVPVFEPQPEPLAALSRRVKESFDPRRILNPGRMAADL
jgi:glycolate oxidase FAD binding subunit